METIMGATVGSFIGLSIARSIYVEDREFPHKDWWMIYVGSWLIPLLAISTLTIVGAGLGHIIGLAISEHHCKIYLVLELVYAGFFIFNRLSFLLLLFLWLLLLVYLQP